MEESQKNKAEGMEGVKRELVSWGSVGRALTAKSRALNRTNTKIKKKAGRNA